MRGKDKVFKYAIEEMKEVKEKLKNEEGSDIMHVHEVLRRDREIARKDGIKTGKLQQAIIVAKKMLAENLDVNLITKITGLKKEQCMK